LPIKMEFRQEDRRARLECLVVVVHEDPLNETAPQRRRGDAPGDRDPPPLPDPPPPPPDRPPPPPQCNDDEDNDGDGRTDFPVDPGCESRDDDSELGEPQCSDGLDNDGDGKTDHPADPGCSSPADDSELDEPPPPPPPPGTPACNDRVDNDSDGEVDVSDFGCETAPGPPPFNRSWDVEDQSEEHVSRTISCETPGTVVLTNTNSGSTLERHLLASFGALQTQIMRERGDGDFESGGPVMLRNSSSCMAPSPTDPGQLSASWRVTGPTTVEWTVVSTGGVVGSMEVRAVAITR